MAPDILNSWHLLIIVSCKMKVPLHHEEIKVCIYLSIYSTVTYIGKASSRDKEEGREVYWRDRDRGQGRRNGKRREGLCMPALPPGQWMFITKISWFYINLTGSKS